MVIEIVRVGKKGEVYLPRKVLEATKIRPGDRVRIRVVDEYSIVVEKELSIDDVLGNYVAELSIEEVERVSEEVQREYGLG